MEAQSFGDSMGGFKRRNDAFASGQRLEGGEGFVVVRADISSSADVLQMGVLRPDSGVIEPGGD